MSEAVEGLLRELSADEYWRREEALNGLRASPPTTALLDELAAALADERAAERRNSARSALAALASPGAARPDETLRVLTDLLGQSEDSDVRLLAAAALGESCNPEARPALERALHASDPNVAAGAAEALGMLGDPRAVDALSRALGSDSFWVRAAAVSSLGAIGGASAVDAVAGAVDDAELAPMVASALGSIGAAEGLEPLGRTLERHPSAAEPVLYAGAQILGSNPELEPPEWLREVAAGREAVFADELATTGEPTAARLLGIAGSPAAAQVLVREMREPSGERVAVLGLSLLPRAVAVRAILARLSSGGPDERLALISALPPLPDENAARKAAAYLGDPAPEVRMAAAEALGRSDPEIVLPTLQDVVRQPETRLAAIRAYARLGHARCEPLDPLLEDPNPAVRSAAAEGLARCGGGYTDRLRAALARESDAQAKIAMVAAVGIAGGSQAAQDLASLAAAEDPRLRFAAVEALGRTGAPEAYPPLLKALVDGPAEIQAAALQALGRLGDPRAAEPVADRLSHEDRDLRRTAVFALDRLAPPGALDRLDSALEDPDREVRITAIRLIARIADDSALPRLESIADTDPEPLVRRAACDAADALRRRLGEVG